MSFADSSSDPTGNSAGWRSDPSHSSPGDTSPQAMATYHTAGFLVLSCSFAWDSSRECCGKG